MEDMKKQGWKGLSASTLHILAMAFMLCDHMWATVLAGHTWMNTVGRLAFPIFAFFTVEGYFHTRSLKKYVLRLLIFAVISEIPFNLMNGGGMLYPFHQNVLWTMLLGLMCIHLNELARGRKLWVRILTAFGTAMLGFLMGTLAFVDYSGAGVLMILSFYFFRGRKWWCCLGQLVMMYYLNAVVIRGMEFPVTLFGREFFFSQQGAAVLALIPIWLYRGEKGIQSRAFQYACYGFYPAHMLILSLIALCTAK